MVDLDVYTNVYFSNGFDVPYKLRDGGEISIKPVLVKDYNIYEWACQVIQLLKNETNDVNIIQMSYLQYLVEVVFPQNEEFKNMFMYLLSLCLGVQKASYFKNDKGKWRLALCDDEDIVIGIVTPKEWDEIMFIILNQNDAHYDNRYVNPEVREMMQEYYKIKYRDIVQPSLEKRKAFVCSKIGKTFKELSELTIREFNEIYKACVDSEIYLATKITEASYKYEVKQQAKHPLFEADVDAYEEAFSDTNVLQNKGLSGANNIGQSIGD